MFGYKVKYKINDMRILKILHDYCLTQSDLNIFEYTDTKLFANFKPWNETIQILKGELILTECGNSIPISIEKSIEKYCTRMLMLSPYYYLWWKKPVYEHQRELDYELHLEISLSHIVRIRVYESPYSQTLSYDIYHIYNYNNDNSELWKYELYDKGTSSISFDKTVLAVRGKLKSLIEVIDTMSRQTHDTRLFVSKSHSVEESVIND